MFKDLKVIELASVLAGPSVGLFFAELGAEVIKIEPPSGDVTRSWKLANEDPNDDRSSYFSSVNWGKKSILLDLKNNTNLERLYQMVKQADIVITSYKPGDAKKLGVCYDCLKKYNDQIIVGEITGYGENTNRVGYDAIIQAEAGFMSMNGQPGCAPTKMPVALMDILTAHQLKEGLLCALLHKEKSGQGSLVKTSLIQSGIASLANQATNYLKANIIPGQMGSEHPNIVPYGTVFKTKDKKHILLAVGTDKQFSTLCNILDISLEKGLFETNLQRVENRQKLIPVLEKAILKEDSSVLISALHQVQIPAGIIKNIKDVFDSEYGQKQLFEYENLKGLRSIAFEAKFIDKQSLKPPSHLNK